MIDLLKMRKEVEDKCVARFRKQFAGKTRKLTDDDLEQWVDLALHDLHVLHGLDTKLTHPGKNRVKAKPQTKVITLHDAKSMLAKIERTSTPREGSCGVIRLTSRIELNADVEFQRQLDQMGPVENLRILITSCGGNGVATDKILSAMMRHNARKITTVAFGECHSAASEIFLAGDERIVAPFSALLLHNATVSGDPLHPVAIQNSEQMLDRWYQHMKGVSLAQVREWQHLSTYFDSNAALRFGLATRIDNSMLELGGRFDKTGLNYPIISEDRSATRAFAAKVACK